MTGTRRTPLCLALLASLAACTADGGSDEDPPSPSPTATAPASFAEPPDGAEIVVAETGFSAEPSEEEAADILSYGVIVENTSGEFVALDSTVSIRLLDADGNAIDEISGEPTDQPARRQSVTRLLPGERIGFGGTVPHHGAEVADLAVEVETATWSPVSGELWWSQPITASGVTTQDTTGASVLRFTVDAAYTQEMISGELVIGGHFTAIFRDSNGAVVGGADCCHGSDGNAPVEVPPGESEGQLTLDFGTPARADDARTEVYLPDPRENLPG